MSTIYRVPLVLTLQPDGGYVLTSPLLPELLTEGATVTEAIAHVDDALLAVVELYEDLGRLLPPGISRPDTVAEITLDHVVVGA